VSLTPRLRHRVDIHELSTSVNSNGDTVEEWSVLYHGLAAEVLTGPGREGRLANTTIGETDLRVTMRWFAGLTYAHRVVFNGKAYGIVEMLTDRTGLREHWLKLKEDKDYVPLSSSSSS